MSVFMCIAGVLNLLIAFSARAHKIEFVNLIFLDTAGLMSEIYSGSPWEFSKYRFLFTSYGITNFTALIITGVILIIGGVFLFIFKWKLPKGDYYKGNLYLWRIMATVFVPFVSVLGIAPVIGRLILGDFGLWGYVFDAFLVRKPR